MAFCRDGDGLIRSMWKQEEMYPIGLQNEHAYHVLVKPVSRWNLNHLYTLQSPQVEVLLHLFVSNTYLETPFGILEPSS